MPKPVYGLFKARESKKFSGIIKIDSEENAKESIKKMKEEFNSADTHDKKLHVIRSLNSASNIAKVMSKNKRNKESTRNQKEKISKLYREAQQDLSVIL